MPTVYFFGRNINIIIITNINSSNNYLKNGVVLKLFYHVIINTNIKNFPRMFNQWFKKDFEYTQKYCRLQ